MAQPSLSTAAVVGSTGLVGSRILSTLLTLPSSKPKTSTTHAIARRALPTPPASSTSTFSPHTDTDTGTWAGTLQALQPAPQIVLSALGTTKGAAGSLAAQRAVDYDLNLALAEAAHAAGTGTYVLVSTNSASPSSFIPYSKMKGELEEAVMKIGFSHTVLLRPGLLVGDRTESRAVEGALRGLAKGAASISTSLMDFWAQDADVVARAAVKAGMECLQGKRAEGVWVLEQAEIIKLGRTEWNGGN